MKAIYCMLVILLGCIGQLVVAEENVCSSFCTSLGMLESSPAKSRQDIYQINKATRGASGLYWVATDSGAQQVYCDMELERCGGQKGGWMRIADLNTSRGDDCPTGWNKTTTPNPDDIAVCRSPSDRGCFSVNFPTGVSYSQMCGQLKGYQKGSTEGFDNYQNLGFKSINSRYVDGVSITVGDAPRRTHVWTYVTGITDGADLPNANCPCAATPGPLPPSFVGNHFYCESGATTSASSATYYTDDPLWDGDGCIDPNNNCCTSPGMPWFHRRFPVPQQADVEVRICGNNDFSNEATLVELLQLYIQ